MSFDFLEQLQIYMLPGGRKQNSVKIVRRAQPWLDWLKKLWENDKLINSKSWRDLEYLTLETEIKEIKCMQWLRWIKKYDISGNYEACPAKQKMVFLFGIFLVIHQLPLIKKDKRGRYWIKHIDPEL